MAKIFEVAFALGGKIQSSLRSSVLSAQGQIESLGAKIDSLGQARAKVDAFRSLRSEMRTTQQALLQARGRTAELGKELSGAKRPSEELQRRFQAARTESSRLKQSFSEQKTELHQLKAEMSKSGLKGPGLFGQGASLGSTLERLRGAKGALETTQIRQAGIQERRSELRGQAVDALALGYALQAPFRTAIGFEQKMAEVKAISGETGASFAALTKKARELGDTTSFSSSEAAEGMKYLAMSGMNAENIMAAMPGMLNMAKAGAMDLGRSSEIASDILSGFKINASEMGTVADVLTQTINSSSTGLDELADTMKYVGPVAQAAGVSLQETAAMAGLLGNVGIKGSQAGTALRAAILRLAAPPRMAADALAQVGVSALDTAGNVRPVIETLTELAAKTEQLGSGAKLEVMKKIFGEEAAAGMTELISQAGAGGIQAFLAKIKASQGAAAQMASVMGDTTLGRFQELDSAVEGLQISLATLFLPAVQAVAKTLQGFTTGITALVERFPNLSKAVGALVFGLIGLKVASIGLAYAWTFVQGGALSAVKAFQTMRAAILVGQLQLVGFRTALAGLQLGSVISSLKTLGASFLAAGRQALAAAATGLRSFALSIVSLGKTAIPALLGGLKTVALFLLTNPIGLAITAIAASAFLIYRYWGPIKGFFIDLWTGIKAWFDGFSLYEAGASLLRSLVSGIESLAMAPVNAVRSIFAQVAELLPFSDARRGPFSQLTASGQGLVEAFGAGIASAGSGAISRPLEASFGQGLGISAFAPAGAAAGGGAIQISFSPTINLQGASGSEVKGQLEQGLLESEQRLREMLQKILERDRRLSL